MQLLVYFLFRFLVFVVGLCPFWLLYGLSDFAYLLLYKLLGYRKIVVQQNLKNSFPERTDAERLALEKAFYHHLFDILVESIKGFSLSKETLLQRQKMLNNLPQQMIDKHGNVLVVGGHCGNWEWGGINASAHINGAAVVFYSPIHNRYIDQYIKHSREVQKTYFWSSPLAPRAFKKYKNEPTMYIMIADQTPSNPQRAHWLPFLNQDTAFLRGPGSFAVNYNLPILFVDIKRVKRGYYTMECEIISEPPTVLDAKEITALYAQKLEEKIKEQPASWLWSHKRWKHSRSAPK
mgnify:CR=1 FL=1